MKDNGYVFVSYSSQNQTIVNQIVNELIYREIKYWKAPEMIAAGSNYAREIPEAIKNCEYFLLILSKEAQSSIWVEKEIDMAICHRKQIIPIQIDNVALNDMFKFYLNNVQFIYFPDNPKAAMNIMLGRILDKDTVRTFYTPKEDARLNALRYNKIPYECEYCKGDLVMVSLGTYQCVACGRNNYDDYRKIRNYIEKHGATPAAVIARNTKVKLKTIEQLFAEEYLEIPSSETTPIRCNKCGMPIRTGNYCDSCKDSFKSIDKKESHKDWFTDLWKK